MVKIFVLQGVHDSGKTSTLDMVDKLLHEKYPKLVVKEEEFNYWIMYELQVHGRSVYVGVKADGDDSKIIREDINCLLECECEIIFCACRSKGHTVEAVKRFSKEADITFVKKTLEADESKQRKVNTADAQKLLALAGL